MTALPIDQIEAYPAAKGIRVAEAERWLASNLGYKPAEVDRAAE